MKNSWVRDASKFALGSASVLAGLYLALSPRVATGLYGRMMFHPHPYPQGSYDVTDVEGYTPEDIYFKARDGKQLHGWFFSVPTSTYTVLFSHGNTGNITGRPNLIGLLIKCGLSVFIYDYRGYGRSQGSPSVSGVCEDAHSAFDYLVKERRLNADEIIVYGESLGAAITSELASKRDCAGIILQSGFASLRMIGMEVLPFVKIWPSVLFPVPGLDSLAAMAIDKKPLLIIHGEKDTVVPFSQAEAVFKAAADPKMFVRLKNAAHSDLWYVDSDVYIAGVKKFLSSLPATVTPAPQAVPPGGSA